MDTIKCSCGNEYCNTTICAENAMSGLGILVTISAVGSTANANIYLDTESSLELIRELKRLLLARNVEEAQK
jgi:hypothetical protein